MSWSRGFLMPAVSGHRSKTRVLIINAYDEREMYADALRAYGFNVTTAATVTAARTFVRTQDHDVIVHGLMFPDSSGLELASFLAQGEHSRTIPRIVLSGFTDKDTLEAIQATGCDAVLIKPCNPRALEAEIRRVLARRRRRSPDSSRTRRSVRASKS